MPVEIFRSDDGMLMVEKHSSSKEKTLKVALKSQTVTISYSNLLDTAFSFLKPEFIVQEYGEGRKCAFCGKRTSLNNRYVCPECWGQYESDILVAMKEATADLVVDIE